MRPQDGRRRGLQVDHQVGLEDALLEDGGELVVERQLVLGEVEVREDAVLGEQVVGDHEPAEEVVLEQVLLLPETREQEEDLRLEGEARPVPVELREERIVLHHLEVDPGAGARREQLHEARLADPDHTLNDNVPPGQHANPPRPPRAPPDPGSPPAKAAATARPEPLESSPRGGNRLPGIRQDQVGRQFGQGRQDEAPLRQPRVGQREPRIGAAALPEQQDVQVQRPRPQVPVRIAAQPLLQTLEHRQQRRAAPGTSGRGSKRSGRGAAARGRRTRSPRSG